MNIENLSYRIIAKAKRLFSFFLFQYIRIIKYRFLSNCKKIQGKPKINQPVLICGDGKVFFGKQVAIGVAKAPCYYNSYVYIDVRKASSCIIFGDNVWINNSCSFVSEGAGIEIGRNTIIGRNCDIIDSDFHALDPRERMYGLPKTEKVAVGANVFIGADVKILKGVEIGDNTIIGNSSVVTKSIPVNVIAGGNPAKILRNF
jgi:maltose O-acetyltransferase